MHEDQLHTVFISWDHRGKKHVAAASDKGWDVQGYHSTWQHEYHCNSSHASVCSKSSGLSAPRTGGTAQNIPIPLPGLKGIAKSSSESPHKTKYSGGNEHSSAAIGKQPFQLL